MSELEELMKQKTEIERRIRELKNTEEEFGDARYFVKRYPSGREDYCVSVKAVDWRMDKNTRYKRIVEEENKDDVIYRLNKLIDDLQGLVKKLQG